jgi:hypothetical protein
MPSDDPSERSVTPQPWGAFAAEISTLTGPAVAQYVEGTSIRWWRLIRTAGYVDRSLPTLLDVTGPSPIGYWHTTITLPADALKRWHGFRYVVLGAVVPAGYDYPRFTLLAPVRPKGWPMHRADASGGPVRRS